MSILISELVTECARQIGDPNKTRVVNDEWLGHYNMSARELCQKANVLKFRATFALDTTATYAYPDNMTVMTALEATATPSDESTYRFLDEKFEDEFRAMTSGGYPRAEVPDRYFADTSWYYLIGRPTAQILLGGRISYYGLPARAYTIDAVLDLPALARDYITRRMVVYGLYSRHRNDEAAAMLQLWYADVVGLNDSMTDRSQDRRSALRTQANPLRGMR